MTSPPGAESVHAYCHGLPAARPLQTPAFHAQLLTRWSSVSLGPGSPAEPLSPFGPVGPAGPGIPVLRPAGPGEPVAEKMDIKLTQPRGASCLQSQGPGISSGPCGVDTPPSGDWSSGDAVKCISTSPFCRRRNRLAELEADPDQDSPPRFCI